ncbi:MAG: DUF5132 domain-containing protein [Gammaproteobacteria bacterium]|jgi:hypothetical protein
MAIEDTFKSGIGKGIAIGIGMAIITPVVLPILARAGRPLTRAAIKSGMLLYDKGRETFAELSEVAEDLIAEARAELEQEEQYSAVDETGESGGVGEAVGESTVETAADAAAEK